jgi:hypothetical protein
LTNQFLAVVDRLLVHLALGRLGGGSQEGINTLVLLIEVGKILRVNSQDWQRCTGTRSFTTNMCGRGLIFETVAVLESMGLRMR